MRVVFTPWGSFGDLHPYLAVALEMKRRGHDVLVATIPEYREKVEGEGLAFSAVRPAMQQYVDDPKLMASLMDRLRGTEHLMRRILMPAVRDMYRDVSAAAEGAELLVGHLAAFATPLVAEKTGVPWVSVALQPSAVWSCYDPPYFPIFGDSVRLSPAIARMVFALIRNRTAAWMKELQRFRRELGLPPASKHPLFEGQFSPFGTLAFFSRWFAQPQPDWPANVTVTGFPFYDKLDAGSAGLTSEVERFLAAGPPPVLFTLGTSAVLVPSDFYATSAAAVEKLNLRAILLAGLDFQNRTSLRSSQNVLVTDYAPYSALFPRAAAVVHSGGIGTTAQVLRAGKPMIVVPFSHDQPDNAARAKRFGIGTTIPRSRYHVNRVAQEIEQVLMASAMAARASQMGERIRAENGIEAAANALERRVDFSPRSA
jgi:MGT family glycosyltransferase